MISGENEVKKGIESDSEDLIGCDGGACSI